MAAITKAVETGTMPAATPGKAFFDTGVGLITNAPVAGMDQLTVDEEITFAEDKLTKGSV